MAMGGIIQDGAYGARITPWLLRVATWLPVSLALLLVVALVGVIIDPAHDKARFTAFLFMRQDLIIVLGIILLIRFATCSGVTTRSAWTETVAAHPWLVALGLCLACWAGHNWLLEGYDLTRDEQMAHFDADIFASGRLNWPIPVDWRPAADALNQLFILPIADRQAWVSAYLPINAAARALMAMVGAESSTGPLFTAMGGIALWRITVQLWPKDAGARGATLLLYAGSSQIVIQGMTAHAMAAHVALNMLWLALFIRGGAGHHAAAILVGFLATGLHQPLFHPLFIMPFLVGLVLQRRWTLSCLYGAGYLAIGLFWLSWPNLAAAWAGGPMEGLSNTGDRLGYVDRIVALLRDLGPISLWLMTMNLLRFAAWQHLLILPLAAAGIGLAWRARLIRPLAIGIALHIVVIGVLLAFQGHGWGYRYLHGVIGSLCLIGGQGFHVLGGRWPGKRLWAWTNAATFLALLPLHGWMAARMTQPYAEVSARIDRLPAAVAVIDEGAVAFGTDLVINRPDLSNRPIRLLSGYLSLDQIERLCARHIVAFVGLNMLSPIRQAMDAQPASNAHFQALRARCGRVQADVP